ncbi:hypothetical protein SAMN05444365_102238 [Micromonospora pattaloongensis]|uniref:Uncharacterized protein n=1 Tax=Micromonospora pattaloongensis TaxID=405436 RepID=A0A1H3JSV9_9ACTN|nr:hypothetical protein SAMN05444365_102238 [Micromonospora pattaloongensis]
MLAQAWDFGPFGNPTWRHFPEAREAVKDLICDELQRAIDAHREPEPVDDFEYVVHAVGPLFFDQLGKVNVDLDLVRRFCLFCRDVMSDSGPAAGSVSYTFNMYVLDGTDHPAAVRVLRQVDPELVEMVHTRYPGRWAERP